MKIGFVSEGAWSKMGLLTPIDTSGTEIKKLNKKTARVLSGCKDKTWLGHFLVRHLIRVFVYPYTSWMAIANISLIYMSREKKK